MTRDFVLHAGVALAFVAVCAGSARAGDDWYVDALHGDDAHDGSTPAAAWRTLAHAGLAAPPSAFTTVHVAPGVYHENGVRFRGQRLVGDGGREVTIVDGVGGGTSGCVLQSYANQVDPTVYSFALVRGVTLRNAPNGIAITAQEHPITTVVEDVAIEDAQYGIVAASLATTGAVVFADVHLTLKAVESSQTSRSLWLWDAGTGRLFVDAADSRFRGASEQCLRVEIGDLSHGGGATASFVRCRFDDGASEGVRVLTLSGGEYGLSFVNCVFARGGAGIRAFGDNSPAAARDVRLQDCTVVDHAGPSVTASGPTAFHVRGSLFWGNSPDAPSANVAESAANWIGLGDPRFVDAAHDDYRLRPTSPCIDQGDASSSASGRDLAGHERPIDGDLDLAPRNDVGAFELAPLDLRSSNVLGGPARLSLSAPTSGTAYVFFVRGGYAAPQTVGFGTYWLGTSPALLWSPALTGGVTTVLRRPIPSGPALAGQTLSFQALMPAPSTPGSAAWSNPVQITIAP